MVTTPLLPSDYLDLVSPLRAGADLRGRIEAVHPETGDAATVVIRPGRGWRGHTAGHYVRIGVDVNGVRLWRAYSITSPTNRRDGRVTITVKAIPDGKVSNHLVRRAKPGTLVQLDQPTGDFVLPQAKPAKVLYLTAGSGITPVMGMLRDIEFAVVAAFIIILFAVFTGSNDPQTQAYLQLYGLMAVMGVIIILSVQALVSLAILIYYQRHHNDETHWWKTQVAPLLALLSQAYVVYLLFDNISFLGSGYSYAKWFGPIDLVVVLIGVGAAFYFKKRKPAKYEQAGRLINEGL